MSINGHLSDFESKSLKDTGRSNRSQFALITIFFLGELDAMSLSILKSILQRNDASERCSSWLRFFITEIARHTGEASDFQISNLQRGRWWLNQLYSDHHLLCGLTAVSSSSETKMQNLRIYSMKVLLFMDDSSMTCAFCVHQFARPARLKQAPELRYEDSSFRFSSQGDLKRQVVQFLWCDYGEFKACTS